MADAIVSTDQPEVVAGARPLGRLVIEGDTAVARQRIVCTSCDSKIPVESFCPQCGTPTVYCSAQERIVWEMGQWESSRPEPAKAGAPKIAPVAAAPARPTQPAPRPAVTPARSVVPAPQPQRTVLPAKLVDVPGSPIGDYHAIRLP